MTDATASPIAWSVRHPIGVMMLTLAVMVLGGLAVNQLAIDLLPQMIYPDVRVRVLDPGTPANIMEDQITRQLEEQLAITEGAIAIQSRTSEGRSAIDLSFAYGTDIDQAFRDASVRLERAKRFLPNDIDSPIIYKRDPSQRPVIELVISSSWLDQVKLRDWVDYRLRPWFLTLPGVAAIEVGGGLQREIQILLDQQRMAALGLDVLQLRTLIQQANQDRATGRLEMFQNEIAGRAIGRFASVQALASLPIILPSDDTEQSPEIALHELAQIADGAEQERVRIRLDGQPGIKLSVQKQPTANTVRVVESVQERIAQLQQQQLIPAEIQLATTSDQAVYIRQSLNNASQAALGGAVLAMIVVYLFLGSVRGTLIIGTAIPIAILVTFVLMAWGGLTLNMMTLGGLALGVGMLVDNTIVMLENIARHREQQADARLAAIDAAHEVASPIIAATATNLAAVLPFLFISGLIGLLFRELIVTISAAILASMLVALTLVPALGGLLHVGVKNRLQRVIDWLLAHLQKGYCWLLQRALRVAWLVLLLFLLGLAASFPLWQQAKQNFLPTLDNGQVTISLIADPGSNLNRMDQITQQVEQLIAAQPEVDSQFTLVGGFVYGRSQFESANRATIEIKLHPLAQRQQLSTDGWIKRLQQQIAELRFVGVNIRIYQRGIPGIRLNRGDADLSLRLQGPETDRLVELAEQLIEQLEQIDGLRNLSHSAEENTVNLGIQLDQQIASNLGLSVESVGQMLQFALEGQVVSQLLLDDRSLNIRLRLQQIKTPGDLENLLILSPKSSNTLLRLGDFATINLVPVPANILRDQQQRIVEISASLSPEQSLSEVLQQLDEILAKMELPPGYFLYEAGSAETLREGQSLGIILLWLALFLVFVVMAVQYESLRNPLVILFSIPFASIGVILGLNWSGLAISMPVWLGLIMLTGIVVNNAIVLVEYIELEQRRTPDRKAAIVAAARLRLRPILMTTLTTVVGLLPLALALSEGTELLQPLAVTLVSGLSFSLLVSLLLVPVTYWLVTTGMRQKAK